MRIGISAAGPAMKRLGELNSEILGVYHACLAGLLKPVSTKVMLADGTVTDQSTFDPALIEALFADATQRLKGWRVRDVSITRTDDLRRIFTKFEVDEGRYTLAGHVSVQFHALLYYKPDGRVTECQGELAKLAERAEGAEAVHSGAGDKKVRDTIEKAGHGRPDAAKLFRILYEDDKMREDLERRIEDGADPQGAQLRKRRAELLDELDSLLIETYRGTDVMIDETRLVSGEEGILCTFDLGVRKEAAFNPKKIPEDTLARLLGRMAEFASCLKTAKSNIDHTSQPTHGAQI